MAQPETIREDAPADVTTSAEPAASAASEADSASSSLSDVVDDFDAVLAEYDQANGHTATAADQLGIEGADGIDIDSLISEALASGEREAAWDAERQQFRTDAAQYAIDAATRNGELARLNGIVRHLEGQIAEQQQREFQAHDLQQFQQLVSDAQAKLEGLDVDDDHAQRWLLSEAIRDPQLVAAWNSRYYREPNALQRAEIERAILQRAEELARAAVQIKDPVQKRLASQYIHEQIKNMYVQAFPNPELLRREGALYVNRAVQRMIDAAHRPRIDANATEDRALVTQAVRSAGGRMQPDPPPDMTNMSNKEYGQFVRDHYGFNSSVAA